MSAYPNDTKPTKAIIVSIPPGVPVPNVVVLQYNPQQLSRTIAPKHVQTADVPVDGEWPAGPPEETITLTAKISAANQPAASGPVADEPGVHAQLAALEAMVCPQSRMVSDIEKAPLGILEVVPPDSPSTVLVWDAKRAVPVQLTGYAVSETTLDPNLNPITADVCLTFKVLTYQECTAAQANFAASVANLMSRELLSKLQ